MFVNFCLLTYLLIFNFVKIIFLKENFAQLTISGDVEFNAVMKTVVNVQYRITLLKAINVSNYSFTL